MSQSRFCLVALTGVLWLWTAPLAGQNAPSTEFKLFGHITSTIENEGDERFSDFSLGEHDLFVTSKITPKISFLGETVVAPLNSHGHGLADFKVSMERAAKYEFREWLSVIVGKMHTPVNYWNDVYHHGRLFFPTIDRPRSFGAHVPIHTLGLRLQGQNIGKLRFGYDLVVGNGMSSNDVSDGNFQKSVTAAVHIKPEKQMRVNLSYYSDIIYGNMVGAHSGHAGGIHYTMGDEDNTRLRGAIPISTSESRSGRPTPPCSSSLGTKWGDLHARRPVRTQAIDLHIKSNDLLKVGLGNNEFALSSKPGPDRACCPRFRNSG